MLYVVPKVYLHARSLNAVNKCCNTTFMWLRGLGRYGSTRLLFLSYKIMSLSFHLITRCCIFSSLFALLPRSMTHTHTLLTNVCLFAMTTESFRLHKCLESNI